MRGACTSAGALATQLLAARWATRSSIEVISSDAVRSDGRPLRPCAARLTRHRILPPRPSAAKGSRPGPAPRCAGAQEARAEAEPSQGRGRGRRPEAREQAGHRDRGAELRGSRAFPRAALLPGRNRKANPSSVRRQQGHDEITRPSQLRPNDPGQVARRLNRAWPDESLLPTLSAAFRHQSFALANRALLGS